MSKWAKHPIRAVAAAAVLFLGITLVGVVQPGRLSEPPAGYSLAAETTLRAYFEVLSQASNLTPEQMGAAGGTVGMGTEPYETAYAYLSAEWRTAHPYAEYETSWKGTASVELVHLLPAGAQDGGSRFFVETRNLEAIGGDKPRLGHIYRSGFALMKRAPAGGWVIADVKLEPEELAFTAGGHSPWRADAELVARQALGGRIDAPLGEAKQTRNADGTVTVHFTQPGKAGQGAVLVRRFDGIWEVIRPE